MVLMILIYRMVLLIGQKMKSNIIRKITIGKDYKNDSMHYAVDQEVYGGHKICDIIEEEDKYCIYIRKKDIVIPWKDFNKNMAISVEYNLEY
jgi:hypothetical protein